MRQVTFIKKRKKLQQKHSQYQYLDKLRSEFSLHYGFLLLLLLLLAILELSQYPQNSFGMHVHMMVTFTP